MNPSACVFFSLLWIVNWVWIIGAFVPICETRYGCAFRYLVTSQMNDQRFVCMETIKVCFSDSTVFFCKLECYYFRSLYLGWERSFFWLQWKETDLRLNKRYCYWRFLVFQSNYRPERSWAKVIFSEACVKNSVHGGGGVCLSACWDTPPWEQTPPQEHMPPRSRHPPWSRNPPGADTPPGAYTPWSRHPHPPGSRPPRADTHTPEQTPPPGADCSIRSTSGRYASYWNAFLLDEFKWSCSLRDQVSYQIGIGILYTALKGNESIL